MNRSSAGLVAELPAVVRKSKRSIVKLLLATGLLDVGSWAQVAVGCVGNCREGSNDGDAAHPHPEACSAGAQAGATSRAGGCRAPPPASARRPSASSTALALPASPDVLTAALSSLQENIPAAGGRLKRKVVSPNGKSGPLAKRTTAAALTTAAPRSAAPSAGAPTSASDEGAWEAVAAEMGWTLADCLGHKLAFAKRADAKAKVEVLATHVKRLRAAGWHLLDARDRAAAEAVDAGARAAAEAAGRREDKEAADAALQQVQAQLGAATAAAARTDEALAEQRAQVPFIMAFPRKLFIAGGAA